MYCSGLMVPEATVCECQNSSIHPCPTLWSGLPSLPPAFLHRMAVIKIYLSVFVQFFSMGVAGILLLVKSSTDLEARMCTKG